MKKWIITSAPLSALLCSICALNAFAEESECSAVKTKIFSSIETAKHCSKDSDCVAESLGCPFGCDVIVNRTEVPALRAKVFAFWSMCGDCEYKCARVSGLPACQNGLCQRVEK